MTHPTAKEGLPHLRQPFSVYGRSLFMGGNRPQRRGRWPLFAGFLFSRCAAFKTVGRCPFSPTGSGDAAQWAASVTDRRGSGDQALDGARRAPAPLQAFCKRAVTSQWDVAQQPTESADEKSKNFTFGPRLLPYFSGLKLSFSFTERLNTSAPGLESLLSTQK